MPAEAIAAIVDENNRLLGSGFACGQGLLLTCAHVVGSDPTRQVVAIFEQGANRRKISCRVAEGGWFPRKTSLLCNEDDILRDVAVLQPVNKADQFPAEWPIAGARPKKGVVKLTGYYRGGAEEDRLSETIYAPLQLNREGPGWLQAKPKNSKTDAPIKGMSGCPAAHKAFYGVVGMLAQGQEDGRGVFLMIPPDALRRAVDAVVGSPGVNREITAPIDSSSVDDSPLGIQINYLKEALRAAKPHEFSDIFIRKYKEKFKINNEININIDDIINNIKIMDEGNVIYVFLSVCETLKEFRNKNHKISFHNTPIGRAAVSIYVLAAFRLISLQLDEKNPYAIKVRMTESVVCAVIAAALLGGRVELAPSSVKGKPQGKYIFEVRPAIGGEFTLEEFERAVWIAISENDPEAPEFALGDGLISLEDRKKLNAKLRSRFNRYRSDNHCFGVIVQGENDKSPGISFASNHRAPVFLHDRETQKALFGMEEEDLWSEIEELWKLLI